MKKILLFGMILITGFSVQADDLNYYFCGGYGSEDESYFNLFLQELIDSPEYEPFLRSYDPYFRSNLDLGIPKRNENIEAWQDYLGLTYPQTEYLVFKASEADVRNAIKGNSTSQALSFVDDSFVKKHKQALLYLAYAKYLEPYMSIQKEYYWSSDSKISVEDLPYDKVMDVLKRSWNAETDKELKLRYGYQMVRLAHYKGNFQEAVDYFRTHVESLNHRTIMYYYALDQRGGAYRGLKKYIEANADFFQFFIHTKNRKQQAYQSINITKKLDFQALLRNAKTPKERDDVYLLLGFNDFNNPLEAARSIISKSPDAVQAKVLVARAINQIEREFLPLSYYSYGTKKDEYLKLNPDKRIPFTPDKKYQGFLNEIIKLADNQLKTDRIQDKTFWNFALSYLHLLNKNYDLATTYLSNAENTENPLYQEQQKRLSLLIDFMKQDELTDAFLNAKLPIMSPILNVKKSTRWSDNNGNTTSDFIRDVMANRLFLQGEYAKAFLIQNNVDAIEINPDWRLLDDLTRLVHKKDKNDFENYLLSKSVPEYYNYETNSYKKASLFDYATYLAQVRGSRYLAEFELNEALAEFEKVPNDYKLPRYEISQDASNFNGYSGINYQIFGVKSDGDFSPNSHFTMEHIRDFDFIKRTMNKRELTESLIQLKEIASQSGERAAKANYLLGNFYYNVTSIGYYRHLLNFDINNRRGIKYHLYSYWYYGEEIDLETDYDTRFYYKGYHFDSGYRDDFELSESFYKKGLKQAENRELKAQLLFAAAQSEQGKFYQVGEVEFSRKNDHLSSYSQEYRDALRKYKLTRYRSYFQELRKNYASTEYYQKMESYCLYLGYYGTRF